MNFNHFYALVCRLSKHQYNVFYRSLQLHTKKKRRIMRRINYRCQLTTKCSKAFFAISAYPCNDNPTQYYYLKSI
ncbi:unnamed protein product [Blepharisma stoltei]|uniref:Uncharacterized protein n=1 Tax=Blepharisma stoltei TaxID=1481888 RepID=A0AAU9I701_9CILI|nr:unnamed protein product [Blepharisma stoltei]